MKLSFRIIAIAVFVATCVGGLSLLVTRNIMHETLRREMEERGRLVAGTLANRLVAHVIENEVVPVHEALEETASRTRDILFVYVVGFDGGIFDHTFRDGFPRALAERALSGKELPSLQRLSTGSGPVLEVRQTLIPGMRAAVYVGIDERGMYRQMNVVRNRVIGIIVGVTLLSILVAAGVSRRIARPLAHLAASMRSFGEGTGQDAVVLEGGGNEVRELALAFNRMIAARKQAEDALRRSDEQLRQAQKMEAVGRLAGGVAHDFNNLLTAITGYGELLLARMKEDDANRRAVAEIVKAAERAGTLTSQLLSFSRKQIISPAVLDLNRVVAGLTPMLRRLIGEDIQLRSVLAPGLGMVMADSGQIEQVVLNLAVNARDAMPDGGKITIETKNVDLDEAYALRQPNARQGPHVLLAVSDTGCGIDPSIQPHIFEPFFTTKEKGKGTGLGLATVYGIASQSGGHVTAYSEPGRGTTLKVYLPRVEREGEEPPVSGNDVLPAKGTETVLLVEDEEMVRKLVSEVLRQNGYTVLEASCSSDALRICGEHPGSVHLLVTDVVMPGMSGRALAEQMATLRPGTRVLYMSGYTDNAIVHHGVLDPGVSFIQKPFPPDVLARKVREVLDAGNEERADSAPS